MKGNYFQNVLLLIIANLIIKPIWIFGIDTTVQNKVGLEVFGNYNAILSFSLIFQILLDMGLHTYNSQKIAQKFNRIRYLLPNILIAKVILSLLYFTLIGVGAYLMGWTQDHWQLILILGLLQITTSFLQFIRGNITALQIYKVDVLLSILDKLLSVIIVGAIIIFPFLGGIDIHIFALAQLIAVIISCIIGSIFIYRYAPNFQFNFNPNIWWPIFRKGLPYAIVTILMATFMRGDVVILKYLSQGIDDTLAGKHAEAFRLLDAANNFSGVLMAGWLLPLFANHLKNHEYIEKVAHLTMRVLMIFSVWLCISTYFEGEQIMSFLYEHYQSDDGKLLFLFMLAYPSYCIFYIYSTLNTAAGNVSILMKAATVSAVISILGNLILIPKYGVYGVAIMGIVSISLYGLINYFYAQNKFKFNFSFKKWGGIILLVIADFFINYFLKELTNLSFIALVIINAIIISLLSFIFRIIQLKELRAMVKK